MPKLVPIKFAKPPVVEVVCGVLFSTLQPIKTVHIGLFAESVRDVFPRVEEKEPIGEIMELPQGQSPTIQFAAMAMPPLRRTWFLSPSGGTLLQLQEDRFLFNWKKAEEDDAYPSYELVVEKFELHLTAFIRFLQAQGIGAPVYRQFEMTYVNHIEPSNGLEVGHGNVLVDHIRSEREGRYLPEPEGYHWATSYSLPEDAGRLHVTARTVLRVASKVSAPILRLDMTARGIPKETSEVARRDWFDLAHEWITQGFADSTSQDLHKNYWGRV